MTPVANAQVPVIDIPADLDILAVNEAFDPVANPPWTTKALMPTHRDDFAISEVSGIIYVAGGETFNNCTPIDTLEAYDPVANTWTTKAPMPLPHPWLAGAGTINGKLYVVGGEGTRTTDGCGKAASTVQIYDPSTDTWTTGPDMPIAPGRTTAGRYSMGIAVVNGILYAIGGTENIGDSIGTPVNTVQAYDPAANNGMGLWSTKQSMNTARSSPVIGVVNGKIYAIGGSDLDTVEEYDPATDTWVPRTSIPVKQLGGAGGVINGIIYVVGGIDSSSTVETALSLVQAYDPSSDTWSTAPDMPTARVNLGVAVVNNTLYAVGGNFPGVARVGKQFIYQITASNHPTSYTANNLPPGLTFDTALGLIYGKPTSPSSSPFDIVDFTATNGDGTGSASARLVVLPSPTPSAPVIISSSCATARTSHPFTFQVLAENTSSSAQFTAGGLPPGLIMDRDTGLIHGTPTADGNFGVAVSLTDGPATTQALLQLTFISDPTVPIITSPDRGPLLVPGQFYSYTMLAEPPNATFSYIGTDGIKREGPSIGGPTGLPPGLMFDGINKISGTYTGGTSSGNSNGIKIGPSTAALTVGGGIRPNTITIRPPRLCQIVATNSAAGTGTGPLNFFDASPSPTPTATPTISISASPTQVNEGGNVIFTISASSNTVRPVTINYSMSGKAIFETDYMLSDSLGQIGQITIPLGADSAVVTLAAVADHVPEKKETAIMSLHTGIGYKLAKPKKAKVKILNSP